MPEIYVSVPKQTDMSQAKVSNVYKQLLKRPNLGLPILACRDRCLVGRVLDYEPRGRWSILGWAPISQYVFFLF